MSPDKCGSFISKLRKEQGLTQKELADKLFVSDKAVSKWETGKGYPDVNSLMSLSSYFNVTVNELLSGEYLHSDNYKEKADENIVSAIKESEKNRRKHFIFTILFIIIFVIVLIPPLILLIRYSVNVFIYYFNIESIFPSLIAFLISIILLTIGFIIKNGNLHILHSYHYKNVTDLSKYAHEIGVAISMLSIPVFIFSFLILFAVDLIVQILSCVILFSGVIGCIINIIRIQIKHNGGI